MSGSTLFSIGEALIDMIPSRVGCSFDEVSSFSPRTGGAPANVCAAFARLGGKSAFLSQLGDDPFGHKIARELEACGIDLSHLAFTDKANTALAFVSLEEDGSRTFSFYRKPSADLLYSPEQIDPAWFADAFALHYCSVSLVDSPMRYAHLAAIAAAREAGAIVSFDPNLRFPLWPDRDMLRGTVLQFLPLSNILKISDEELEFLTGTTDIESNASANSAISAYSVLFASCVARNDSCYTRYGRIVKHFFKKTFSSLQSVILSRKKPSAGRFSGGAEGRSFFVFSSFSSEDQTLPHTSHRYA